MPTDVADCVCGCRVLLDEEIPTPCSRCGRVFAPSGELVSGPTKRFWVSFYATRLGACLDRRVWKLSEPAAVGGEPFVFVLTASAANETVAFASDSDGNVLDHAPLPGSFLGGEDHAYAIAGLLSHLNHGTDSPTERI